MGLSRDEILDGRYEYTIINSVTNPSCLVMKLLKYHPKVI